MKISEISNSSNVNPDLIRIIKSGFVNNLKLVASKKAIPIWRGVDITTGYASCGNKIEATFRLLSPKKYRNSATGNNLILMHTSTSIDWKGFPDRRSSSFASSDRSSASHFGDIYGIVIPKDNTKKFGYCKTDLNLAQIATNTSAYVILSSIKGLKYKSGFIHDYEKKEDYKGIADAIKILNLEDFRDVTKKEDIKEYCQKISNVLIEIQLIASSTDRNSILSDLGLSFLYKETSNHFDSSYNPFYDALRHIISPDRLGAKKCSSIAEIPSDVEEVWFEDEYLLIVIDTHDTYKVLNELVEGLD